MSFKQPKNFLHLPLIEAQLNRHLQILNIIKKILPEKQASHLQDCVINQHTVILYVSSAAWASQLRFLSIHIKDAINEQSNEQIHQVQVKALTLESLDMSKKEPKKVPSTQQIKSMRASANASSESRLKQALISLSNTLDKHHDN